MTAKALSFPRLALILLVAAGYAYPANEAGFLQKGVCRFTFHGRNSKARAHNPADWPAGVFLAVRDLASHAEVPICFEQIPSLVGETIVPIEIDARDTTVKDILDEMMRQDPRYEYRERLGVIEVLLQGADRDPTDCLNLIIPSFKEQSEWNGLINDLRVQVVVVSRSITGGEIRGAAGVAHPPPGLIEANFENRTVRDILTLLCARVGNMAWTVEFDAPRVGCQDMTFHTYQPTPWYPSNTVPLTWSKGLPKACLECHYHQPHRAK